MKTNSSIETQNSCPRLGFSPNHVIAVGAELAVPLLLTLLVLLYQKSKQAQKTQRSLQESEELFRAFADNSPAVKFIKDSSGRTKYINKTFTRLFGDQLGKTDEAWLPIEVASLTTHNDQEVLKSGIPSEVVESVPLPDGTPKHWMVIKFRLELQGQPHVAGTAVDITAQKEIEAALRRSNAQLNEFAYVAAHDLQAPLRAIASFLSRLEQRLGNKLGKREAEYIERSVNAAQRMKRLLDDLLAFARTSRSVSNFELVDLESVLASVLDDLQIEPNPIYINGRLPTIMGDRSQLSQLLQNLLSNAVKFQKPDTPLSIIVSAEKWTATEWMISVQDNGIGIEKEYFDKIFQLFQRLHTQTEYEGTGLGLAICKKIVERHGGQIWLESQVGKGSTFYFTLPVGG